MNRNMFLIRILLVGVMLLLIPSIGAAQNVLLFSKTQGFKHESIPAGRTALILAGKEAGFEVDTTNDASKFTMENLKRYNAVVFLNTTGDVLDARQQTAFENYIQAGGGFVGIHSAADTEYQWPWYGKMVGGYFKSHPHIQHAVIHVVNRDHSSTKHLPVKWKRQDEWYNYKDLNPDIKVLAALDEESYNGGENGDFHPISWYHFYDGGRAFYTGGGHTSESYREPDFLRHLVQGILWASNF